MSPRRDRSVRLAGFVLACALVATACGGGTPGASETGVLRFGNYSVNPALDPHRTSSITLDFQIYPVVQRLFEISPTYEVAPMLATGYEYSADGRTLTLRLRSGVSFSDGTPFDAAAVAANLERAVTVPGSAAAGQLAVVESVEVLDPATVQLGLARPDATVPALLAGYPGAMLSPATFDGPVDAVASAPVGTGPYTVAAFIPTQRVSLELRPELVDTPEYRDAPQRIEIRGLTDSAARLSAFRTGEFDMAHGASADGRFERAADEVGGTSFRQSGRQLTALLMLPASEVLADGDVRAAIAAAIDRTTMATTVLADGLTPTEGLFPPTHWAASDTAFPHPYDPARARELLAGRTDTAVSVLVPRGGLGERAGEAVQAQLADVGIRLDLLSVPATEIGGAAASGAADMCICPISVGEADPGVFYARYLTGGFGLAEREPTIAPLVAAAVDPLLDQEQRAQRYREVEAAVSGAALIVPLGLNSNSVASRPDVTGAGPDPNFNVHFDLTDVRLVAVDP